MIYATALFLWQVYWEIYLFVTTEKIEFGCLDPLKIQKNTMCKKTSHTGRLVINNSGIRLKCHFTFWACFLSFCHWLRLFMHNVSIHLLSLICRHVTLQNRQKTQGTRTLVALGVMMQATWTFFAHCFPSPALEWSHINSVVTLKGYVLYLKLWPCIYIFWCVNDSYSGFWNLCSRLPLIWCNSNPIHQV